MELCRKEINSLVQLGKTNKQTKYTHTHKTKKPTIPLWLEDGTQRKIALRELVNERVSLPLVKKLDVYFNTVGTIKSGIHLFTFSVIIMTSM